MHSEKLLVPLSLAPGSKAALTFASRMAERLNASLVLLHVVQLHIADEQLSIPQENLVANLKLEAHEHLRELVGEVGVKVTVEYMVEDGRPAEVIVKKAAKLAVDAIVVVTHGCPRWLRWLHRNMAQKILRHSPCSVWLISLAQNGNLMIQFFTDPWGYTASNGHMIRPPRNPPFGFAA